LNIVEGTTAFRLTVSPSTAVSLNTYSIQGGDITFVRDTSVPLAASYAAGTTNVVLMQGTMHSNAAINVEDPRLSYANSDTDAQWYSGFSTIYIKIGSSTMSYSPTIAWTATGAQFLGTATVDGTVQVKVRGTLKDNAVADVLRLNALQLSSFGLAEYVSNGNTVSTAVGSIEGVNVSIEASQLNVTRTDALGNQTIAAWLNGFTVMKLTLSSNQGNGVRVSRAVFATGASSGSFTNNVSLTLYVDGAAVSTKNLSWASVTFDFPSFTVSNGSSKVLELKANFAEAYSAGQFQLALSSLQAVDVLTSQTVTYQTPSSAIFTIGSASATISASNSPILASLLLSPSSDQKLMAFRVKANNDGVKVRDVTFTGTNLGNLSNFRLSTDGTVAGSFVTATTVTTTGVVFSNISETNAPLIAKDVTATYYLIADTNDNSSASVTLFLTDVSVRATNGATVTPSFTDIAANTHLIAENTLTLAKAANTSKDLATSAMRFTVTASGKTWVTLTGITLTTILAGYTGTATVSIYRTSVVAANLVGSDATVTMINDATVTIPPTANNVVDAGTTATFIVVVTGLGTDPAANTTDWTMTLTNLTFNGTSAVAYNNVGGSLPITETK
jgi:hypothetical protein